MSAGRPFHFNQGIALVTSSAVAQANDAKTTCGCCLLANVLAEKSVAEATRTRFAIA